MSQLQPLGIGHPEFRARADELIRTVKLMSEIKVVRRWPKAAAARLPRIEVKKAPKSIEVVALGASTGGPMVLKMILEGLDADFPAPVLMVQHMSPGFVTGLAEWLGQTTRFPVRVAQHAGGIHHPGWDSRHRRPRFTANNAGKLIEQRLEVYRQDAPGQD